MNTSLLLTIFVLSALSYAISTIGASTFQWLIWRLCSLIPFTSFSSTIASHRKTQRAIIDLRAEMRKTSAQDEFAKWAKLKRNEDKLVIELEKKSKAVQSLQLKVNSLASLLRTTLTNGLKIIVIIYHYRTPVFYLPRGALPSYIEWFLANPGAPKGSVSVVMWFYACGAVLSLVGGVVGYLVGTARGLKGKEKVPVPSGGEKKAQ